MNKRTLKLILTEDEIRTFQDVIVEGLQVLRRRKVDIDNLCKIEQKTLYPTKWKLECVKAEIYR